MKIANLWYGALVLLFISNSYAMQPQPQSLVQRPVATHHYLNWVTDDGLSPKQRIDFDRAGLRLSCDDETKKREGVALLEELASESKPSVRAQYQLGIRKWLEGDAPSAQMYWTMAGHSYPPALRLLGQSLLKSGEEQNDQELVLEGLRTLQQAVGPKECPALELFNLKKPHFYYDEKSAETLARWLGSHPEHRLSPQSFYYTQLAQQLTNNPEWSARMSRLLTDYAEYCQRSALYYQLKLAQPPAVTTVDAEEAVQQPLAVQAEPREALRLPADVARRIDAMAQKSTVKTSRRGRRGGRGKGKKAARSNKDGTGQEEQLAKRTGRGGRGGGKKATASVAKELQQPQDGQPLKPLSVRACIDALKKPHDQDQAMAMLARLKELMVADDADNRDDALMYLLTTYSNGDHGVKQDPDYVFQLLTQVRKRELAERFCASSVESCLMKFAEQSKSPEVNYQLGTLFCEQMQRQSNKGNARQQAITCLQRVPSTDDHYGDAQWRLFDCYVRGNQANKAMEALQNLMGSERDDDQTQNQIKDGLERLEAWFGNQPAIVFFLSKTFADGIPGAMEKDTQKSEALLQEAVQLKHPEALMVCGEAALQKGDATKAYSLLKNVTGRQAHEAIIGDMEKVARLGNDNANRWLYNQLKEDDLAEALRWLSIPIIATARRVVKSASTIGDHRTKDNVQGRARQLIQSINPATRKELERNVQSGDPKIANRARMILAHLYCMDAYLKPDKNGDAKLKSALKHLSQVKTNRVSNLMMTIEYKLGLSYAEKKDFVMAERYLSSAHQKGSMPARNRLLRMLIEESEFASSAFEKGLEVALDAAIENPEIALYVLGIFESRNELYKDLKPASKELFDRVLKEGIKGGYLYPATYLNDNDNDLTDLIPSGDELERELQAEIAKGDADALYKVGVAYFLKKDDAKAIEFLRPAMEKGHSFAQFYLGSICLGQPNTQEAFECLKSFMASAEESTALEAVLLSKDAEVLLRHEASKGNVYIVKFVFEHYLRKCKEPGKSAEAYANNLKALVGYVIIPKWLSTDENSHDADLVECIPLLREMAEINGELAWLSSDVLMGMHKKKIRIPGCVDQTSQLEMIRDCFLFAERTAPQLKNNENHKIPLSICYLELGASYEEKKRYEEAVAAYQEALKLAPNHPCVFRLTGIFFNGKVGRGTKVWRRGIKALEESAETGNKRAARDLVKFYELGANFACRGARLQPNHRKAQKYQALADKPTDLTSVASVSNIFELITRDLLAGRTDEAFGYFKDVLAAGRFNTPEGWRDFNSACEQHQFLEKLKAACKHAEDSEEKALYSLHLGEMYYSWLFLKGQTINSQADKDNILASARHYLGDAQKLNDQSTAVSALSMLTILNAKQLESAQDEEERVRLLTGMIIYMTKAMRTGTDLSIPHFREAAEYVASALERSLSQLSQENLRKLELIIDEYRRLVREQNEACAAAVSNVSEEDADCAVGHRD